MEQKNQKKLLDLKIISLELGTANSDNPEQHTCRSQSMCYETPLRFNISLRAKISESGSPRVMKKYDENPLMRILYKFWILWHVDCQAVF